MSQEFHPLPQWLLSNPRLLRWIYSLQRWVLLRNHVIVPVFKSWFKKQTQQNESVSMVDLGCGEGLFSCLASYIMNDSQTKSEREPPHSTTSFQGRKNESSILGVDFNQRWIDFLNENKKLVTEQGSLLTFNTLDLTNNSQKLREKLRGVNALVGISVLQYMPNPLQELQHWLEALPEKAEVFIYFPIDHHQYTPWYSYLFRKSYNYEQALNRSAPIGKSEFAEFIQKVGRQGGADVVHCSYHYHAFAAIGHEQFSFALMLWQNSRHWSLFPIRLMSGIMLFPAWLLSLLGFYFDRLVPVGSPNSVLCILKKNAYIKE